MTHVYFIRHCQPDTSVHDDLSRPLTEKGLADRKLVSEYLSDKDIHVVLSSPYRRAVDTVGQFAAQRNLTVITMEQLRERRVGDAWIDDFMDYAQRQWEDHDYALENGECLREVESRVQHALKKILLKYQDQNIAIGFHGTALCTIIHHYHPDFGFEDFKAMCAMMPWAVHFTFDQEDCVSIESYDFVNSCKRNIMST